MKGRVYRGLTNCGISAEGRKTLEAVQPCNTLYTTVALKMVQMLMFMFDVFH